MEVGPPQCALPQEIIDAIIDQVAPPKGPDFIRSSNTPSLRACALVSKSFRPRSQKNIFRQIILCPPAYGHSTGRNTPDRLYAVVLSSPWISSYVESVVLSSLDGATLAYTAGAHVDVGMFQDDPDVWLSYEQLLPLLFDSFTRLNTFSFANTIFDADLLYTAEMSLYARLCRGHCIETVRFMGVFAGNRTQVTNILLLFPDMKTLYTTSKSTSTSTDEEEVEEEEERLEKDVVCSTLFEECSDDSPDHMNDCAHHLSSLRHLHLDYATTEVELEGLVNRPFPIQLDRLHSVHLTASEDIGETGVFIQHVARLIEAARSLVHLTLDLTQAPELPIDAERDMPVLPFHRLTTLTLRIQTVFLAGSPLQFSAGPLYTCLFYIKCLATAPAYPSRLEEVFIAIRGSDDRAPDEIPLPWENFADALIQRPEFPRMRRVSFGVRSQAWEEVYIVTPESDLYPSSTSSEPDFCLTLSGKISTAMCNIMAEDFSDLASDTAELQKMSAQLQHWIDTLNTTAGIASSPPSL